MRLLSFLFLFYLLEINLIKNVMQEGIDKAKRQKTVITGMIQIYLFFEWKRLKAT